MCGIAGVLKYRGASHAIGSTLLRMATCLQHRGMDSAGLAVFSAPQPHTSLQIALPMENSRAEFPSHPRLLHIEPESGGFRAQIEDIEYSNNALSNNGLASNNLANSTTSNALADAKLVAEIEATANGATVSAMGRAMRIHKTVGIAQFLEENASHLVGTHGIAHLRLATESRIDPAHAQPFWGRPFPDIAVTHNGHITNYHKLRQKFEARGFGFASHNDSEIIGVYLGDKMDEGATLLEALEVASHELDGSFSFIVATAQGLGVARDPLATKPLLWVENEDGVCLASEPQALYRVLGEGVRIREIKPRETRVWQLETSNAAVC